MNIHKKQQTGAGLNVVTGGPCVGKSTIIDILEAAGYATLPEIAGPFIAQQQQIGGTILPWVNLYEFQCEVARRQYERDKTAQSGSFLDRGFLDGLGYCQNAGIKIPPLLEQVETKYNKVFILDQLPFFENNEQRLEDALEGKRIHTALIDVYKSKGYEPLFVPVLEPLKRAQYILERI